MTGKRSHYPMLSLLGLLLDPAAQVRIQLVQGPNSSDSTEEEEVAAGWPMTHNLFWNIIKVG